jgi:hypothetical protein
MKFFSTLVSSLVLAVVPSVVLATQISYDTAYDVSSSSLDTVSCSNGANGLETKGYTTFGSLPTFPYIGAAQAVAAWNSPNCGSYIFPYKAQFITMLTWISTIMAIGTCWEISYQNTTITVLAIDHAGDGFNLSLEAMNNLTCAQAQKKSVSLSFCSDFLFSFY